MQHSKPFGLLLHDITLRLEASKEECMFYQEHGKRFFLKHLESRRQIALEEEDKEAFKKISAIIQERTSTQLLAQTELCNRKEENL